MDADTHRTVLPAAVVVAVLKHPFSPWFPSTKGKVSQAGRGYPDANSGLYVLTWPRAIEPATAGKVNCGAIPRQDAGYCLLFLTRRKP